MTPIDVFMGLFMGWCLGFAGAAYLYAIGVI